MKKMLYFQAAYLLFSALPFPCILYYSIGYPVDAADRMSPAVATVWLALSILLWALLAAAYVHTLLRAPYRTQARTRAIQRAAIRRRARVVQAQDTGRQMRGWRVWNLPLALDTLSGTPIQDQMLAVDRQPQLQRFVADNQLDALLSDDPGGYPKRVLEGAMRGSTGAPKPLTTAASGSRPGCCRCARPASRSTPSRSWRSSWPSKTGRAPRTRLPCARW